MFVTFLHKQKCKISSNVLPPVISIEKSKMLTHQE